MKLGSSRSNHSAATSVRQTGLIRSMWTRSFSSVSWLAGSSGLSLYSATGSGKKPLMVLRNVGQRPRLVGSTISALPSSNLSFHSVLAASKAVLMAVAPLGHGVGLLRRPPRTGACDTLASRR